MSDVTAINAALTKSRQFGNVRKLESVLGLLGGMAAYGQEQPMKVPALGAMSGGALTVQVLINQGLKATTNGPGTRRKVFATER